MRYQRVNLDQIVQPLVITPSPFHGESLPGFILRAAELNGYDSPFKILNYAGMDENEMRSARPSLEKLAPLFGKSIDEFLAFKLDRLSQSKGRYVEIMGHNIFSIFTSCKNPRVCLQCISELGYVEGFYELKYAVACPKHHIKTIISCHVCGKNLKWHRIGLTKCNCGAQLKHGSQDSITDPAVIALLNVLYSKLMNSPLDSISINACGFPSEAIEKLSVQTILSIIYRFGLFSRKVNDSDTDSEMRAISTTAKVLTDWPNRFHEYLEDIHGPNVNFEFVGLRAQFRSFYESFFKNIEIGQEMNFMREAFVSFGQKHWKKARVHPKLVQNSTMTLVGINALSARINIHPSTIKKLVTRGLVRTTNSHSKSSQLLFDEADQLKFEFAQGKSLSIKNAASILDLPVDILKAYRANGYYQAKYLATPVALFHERDVEQLYKDLIKNCELCTSNDDKELITLTQIMRMKFTAEIKAMFISDVIQRKIVPLGLVDEKPSGLLFSKMEVNKCLSILRESLQGSISFEQSKNILKVTREPLIKLIKANLISCKFQNNSLRIDEKSVLNFQEQI